MQAGGRISCKVSSKGKKHFDSKAKARKLNVGDKVLILLPTDSHKMLMTWKGPYSVVDYIGLAAYRVQLETETKVFSHQHAEAVL